MRTHLNPCSGQGNLPWHAPKSQHFLPTQQAQRGLILMDTDLRHEGEAFVLEALPRLKELSRSTSALLPPHSTTIDTTHAATPSDDTPLAECTQKIDAENDAKQEGIESAAGSAGEESFKALAVLQRCYNALGALWSERSDLVSACSRPCIHKCCA